jgi:acetyltransferase-like isoleucine patch superfamily enzyme
VIYLGSKIGQRFETGHNVIVREENDILDDVKIWSNTMVDFRCKISSNVKIHSNCYISQLSLIEDDVFIAPGVLFANEKYPTGKFVEERISGPVIKKGARIGMGAIIMPGVVVGEHSLIGAGALVTRNVPAGAVYYGVPAKKHSLSEV